MSKKIIGMKKKTIGMKKILDTNESEQVNYPEQDNYIHKFEQESEFGFDLDSKIFDGKRNFFSNKNNSEFNHLIPLQQCLFLYGQNI